MRASSNKSQLDSTNRIILNRRINSFACNSYDLNGYTWVRYPLILHRGSLVIALVSTQEEQEKKKKHLLRLSLAVCCLFICTSYSLVRTIVKKSYITDVYVKLSSVINVFLLSEINPCMHKTQLFHYEHTKNVYIYY